MSFSIGDMKTGGGSLCRKAGAMKKGWGACGMFLLLAAAVCCGGEPVPLRPLDPDEGHDVIVLRECQLALRFAKESLFPAPVKVYQSEQSKSFFFEQTPAASFCLLEDLSGILEGETAHRIIVECFPAGSFDSMSPLTFLETVRGAFFIEEVSIGTSVACDALGLDVASSYGVEGAHLFETRARPLPGPDGQMHDVPICQKIFIIKTQEFYHLFSLEKGDPFEPGATPFRISFEARLDKEGSSRPSVVFREQKPGACPW